MSNSMRNPFIAKVVLSAGATGTDLDKAHKLLGIVTKRKPQINNSGPRDRIPTFGVKPNMPLGTSVTLRKKDARELLRTLLSAIDNTLKKKQVSENHFSFGIKEYIDVPGMEYNREIGIRGFNVTVTFERKGVRIKHKKAKQGILPARQHVHKEEIISFMGDAFQTRFI